MNDKNRITIGLLCFALCLTNWPALAVASGANPGPTCDEVAPATVCSGSVPNVLVTADRRSWLYGTAWTDYLNRLSIDESFAFSELAVRVVRSQLPNDVAGIISDATIRRRQENAYANARNRQLWKDITDWYLADPNRTCNVIASGVRGFGASAAIIGLATGNVPVGLTGVVVSFGGDIVGTLVCSN
ncbi:MAG: hypothetical protein OXC69_00320 [Candidatus Tectomicrobia bacterium]|nr:hypothetical protein [Candidatus Tectomicrobia bacterium]